jgi:glycosyltransferase involved in cell wall biosynthesis
MRTFGKTAAYTILKNEMKNLETWLYYAREMDYRVLLDTGSTDGSWEYLQEAAKNDPNLIIEQKIFEPWNFSVARNYNLDMIPNDVSWCFSPDLDEWFSINVFNDMEQMLRQYPNAHNFATTRLDIYSDVVFVGPPHQLASNKIHRRHDYKWVSPIYEHLKWIHDGVQEIEIHLPNVYLIHNQDFKKPERKPLYNTMLLDAVEQNPSDTWCRWFVVNSAFREQDLDAFIHHGCEYIKYYDKYPVETKFDEVMGILKNMYGSPELSGEQRLKIKTTLKL